MEQKKNPKKDMRRWSLLFFQIGLIVVLFIVWRAIDFKTYEKKEEKQQIVQLTHMMDEDVPVTEKPKNQPPPPPPPPPAPEKVKVVENDEEIEEVEIAPTEDIEEPQPVRVADVQEAPAQDSEPIAEVPFRAVQDVPLFPGCERYKSNEKRKDCMSDKVREFVNRHFDTSIGNDLGLSGVNKIYVQFVIDSKGNVTNIQARNVHAQLRDEAKRVVNLLPKMIPGKQRGKPVKVRYTLPIVFQVN